jgi:hypothetical protein
MKARIADLLQAQHDGKAGGGNTFPHSIFITFNGGKLRCLFPTRLPIFYMYSLRRGVSIKPWFFNAGSSH